MKYNNNMPEFMTKYLVYMLISNDGLPYYVGVTTRGKGRYSGTKKKDMQFIAHFSNRHYASECETFWIQEFTQRGFVLKNKITKTSVVPDIGNLYRIRIKITNIQYAIMVHYIKYYNITEQLLIERALDNLILNVLKPVNYSYPFLKRHWLEDKFIYLEKKYARHANTVNTGNSKITTICHLKEMRVRIAPKYYMVLMDYETNLKIPPSAIIRIALNTFLPKLRDERFKYEGIKNLWDETKF